MRSVLYKFTLDLLPNYFDALTTALSTADLIGLLPTPGGWKEKLIRWFVICWHGLPINT